MSLILIERIANLNGPIIPDTLNGVLNGSEIDAHKFIITATRDGATVALTGTVTASFLRADGAEVVLTGEIENGAATVTLAQSCYTVPGRFDLTIFVTADGVKTGVYACTGGVRNTTSGTIVDPGQIVPSVDDIIAKQAELAQDVADASSAIASAQNAVSYLAPVFSTNRTYAVGEYVTKDGALYICTTAVETAGAWDATNWQDVTFGGELADQKSASNNLTNTLFPHVLRSVVEYPFGTSLNNAFVWVPTDIYIPKGQAGKLTCLNHKNRTNQGKTLHVIKLLRLNDTYTVLSDEIIKSDYLGVIVYISKEETSAGNVYVGFYSTDGGIVYQTSGNRLTAFKRFAYSNLTVGEPVTLSGSFNMDYSFGLSITADNAEAGESSFAIVDATGGGKYTSIIEAINTEPENTAIFVKPGVYEQDMTECLRKRIILIGTDRNTCIIRDTDGRYGHHALYISCGYFENLTIEEPYVSGTSQEVGISDLGAYAVHIDTDEDYSVGKTTEFHHCTIKSDFFPAVGLGMRKDATYIFDDCELTNGQIAGRGDYSDEGTLGALYFHDSNGEQGDQYIKIKGCVLKSNLAYAMCPYKVNRAPQNNRVHCDFVNNVLYSETGKYANTVWFRNDPFNASTGIFSIGIGYGNSISSLNN